MRRLRSTGIEQLCQDQAVRKWQKLEAENTFFLPFHEAFANTVLPWIKIAKLCYIVWKGFENDDINLVLNNLFRAGIKEQLVMKWISHLKKCPGMNPMYWYIRWSLVWHGCLYRSYWSFYPISWDTALPSSHFTVLFLSSQAPFILSPCSPHSPYFSFLRIIWWGCEYGTVLSFFLGRWKFTSVCLES